MHMIGHDREGVQRIVPQGSLAVPEHLYHQSRDFRAAEVAGTPAHLVQQAVHGGKSSPRTHLSSGKETVSGEATSQTPSDKQRLAFGMPVREAALIEGHRSDSAAGAGSSHRNQGPGRGPGAAHGAAPQSTSYAPRLVHMLDGQIVENPEAV